MNREAVLLSLVRFDRPVTWLKVALESCPWGVNDPVIIMTREDLVAILQRFAAGEFKAGTIEEWAHLLEGRNDIQFEAVHAEVISDAISQLAGPARSGPLKTKISEIISKTALGAPS
jgi:hypothetical protein